MPRAAISFIGLIVAATLVASCGSSAKGASSGGSTTTITLYNAQHEQTTSALIAAFTKMRVTLGSSAVVFTTSV